MKSDNKNVQCKDGICTLDEGKNIVVAAQEEKVVTSESTVVEITNDTFDTFVKKSTKPVIIDFYATWCPPCRTIKPIFAELAQEEKNWLFAAIDVDKAPAIMARCGVQAMPSFVIFKDGIQWGMIQGGLPKEQLKNEFKRIIGLDQPLVLVQTDLIQQLMMAINKQNIDEIKKCIADGADVNGFLESPLGKIYPLQGAILYGTEEIIDLLMSSGARMNKEIEESAKKQIDVNQSHFETLKKAFEYTKNRLKALPAKINQIVKISGPELRQEFLLAISMKNNVALKDLIDKGADVNTIFAFGLREATPLYLAIMVNNIAAIDMLIDAGASLEMAITDDHGCKKSVEEVINDGGEIFGLVIEKGSERLLYALHTMS